MKSRDETVMNDTTEVLKRVKQTRQNANIQDKSVPPDMDKLKELYFERHNSSSCG
jgi:hypothetical protein